MESKTNLKRRSTRLDVGNWLASFRQLFFNAAFRIPPAQPSFPLYEEVTVLLQEWNDSHDSSAKTPCHCCAHAETIHREDHPSSSIDQFTDQLTDLGVGLWRLRQKMVDPQDKPLSGMHKAFRHLETLSDVLSSTGITIQDHTSDRFDPGLSLKVIAFQAMPGLLQETVIETIRPSVYLDGRLLQMGEVIVGTPAENNDHP